MDEVDLTDLLVLGHLPMVGISYQGRERDLEYSARFSKPGEMRRIIDSAVGAGISRFATSAPGFTSLASRHLEALRQLVEDGHDISLIPCIGVPIKVGDAMIDAFRRWKTYLAVERMLYPGVEERVLNDPILNFRDGWKQRLPVSKPYDEGDFERLTIDWDQVEEDLEIFADLPVSHMEPGSEIDFLTMAGRFDLVGELVDRIRERGYRRVLFGVHHAGVNIPRLDEELEGLDGYVTPLNPLGVMMFPSKASTEMAVRRTKKDVFAIKSLAGGRVEPERAFTYAFSFDIQGCMIGAASVAEVEEDLRTALEVLRGHIHEGQ